MSPGKDDDVPDKNFKFTHPIKVRFSETDLQGHVFFGQYLTYFDVALMEYLAALGFDYRQLLALDMDMVYVQALCEYRAPAQVEETLHVGVRVRVGTTSLRFSFAAHEAASSRLIVTGRLVAVAIDPRTQQKRPVPEALRRAIAAFEGSTSTR